MNDKLKDKEILHDDGSFDIKNTAGVRGLESSRNEAIMVQIAIEELRKNIEGAKECISVLEQLYSRSESIHEIREYEEKITSWNDELLKLTDREAWELGKKFRINVLK